MTAIEVSTAAVTVNEAVPTMVPDVALIVAVPCATPVASPALFTVATAFDDEAHCTLLVKFCLLPLLYVPVAVYCSVFPAATDAVAGVTAIDVRTGGVTVSVAVPLIFPEVAVIVAVPCATPVAKPVALFTVATDVAEEVQVAVRLFWLPSLYVPVAANCWVSPAATDAVAGVTAMETRMGAVPVPLRDTVCEVETPTSEMVSVPVRDPSALGVKVTEMVQLPPAASVAGLTGQ